jgi:hypothetical protein
MPSLHLHSSAAFCSIASLLGKKRAAKEKKKKN